VSLVPCPVQEGNHLILALKGKNTRTSLGRLTKYIIYTVKDGIPLRANLYGNPIQFRQTIGMSKARLDIGSGHSVCTELQDMGLSRLPVLYQDMLFYEAILLGSKNIIDD